MDPLPEVEIIPHIIDGLHILQLKVNAGHYTPYYYVGDGQRIAFVRVGDESIPTTAEQMVRLVLKGSNKTFDSLHTNHKAEDYSFIILSNTFKKHTHQEWDKKYLISFGLVTNRGNLTHAGALFADVSSERRNPILTNVMAQLGYMEKRGSGLSRICNETKALDGYKDELKPVFKSTPTQFQTIIFATVDTQNVGDYDGDMSKTKLNERQQKMLYLIKESPTITGKQLSEILSVSQRTVERDLSLLKKKGILMRQGKDNDGTWIIVC